MNKKISRNIQEKLQKALLKKEKELKKRIELVRESDPFKDPDHVTDNAAVDTDVREQIGHETVEAQIQALEKNLADVQWALIKMMKKKWGKCERCQKPIDLARLNLLPEARYCVNCERQLRK